MSGRGGDADDATPTSLQEKYRQATSAKTRGGHPASSSSGGEERCPRDQDAEITELRAQVEQLRRQQRVEKGQCKVIR